MAYVYDLTLGLPHTNHRGLSEPLLLMHAGHFQWMSIAAATGGPLSRLRTASGGEVYAAFYYIEERFPVAAHPLYRSRFATACGAALTFLLVAIGWVPFMTTWDGATTLLAAMCGGAR